MMDRSISYHPEHHDSPRQLTSEMNTRRTSHKSTVPRFCAFFLAQRRESTTLHNPVNQEWSVVEPNDLHLIFNLHAGFAQ